MQINATNKSAAITGIYAGLIGLLLGPQVDSGSTAWLFVATAAFAGPAYFFVFGIRREDMVGLWVFDPPLLKRIGLCLAGAICVGTIAQFIIFFLEISGYCRNA
jgi:hypothetical protein